MDYLASRPCKIIIIIMLKDQIICVRQRIIYICPFCYWIKFLTESLNDGYVFYDACLVCHHSVFVVLSIDRNFLFGDL